MRTKKNEKKRKINLLQHSQSQPTATTTSRSDSSSTQVKINPFKIKNPQPHPHPSINTCSIWIHNPEHHPVTIADSKSRACSAVPTSRELKEDKKKYWLSEGKPPEKESRRRKRAKAPRAGVGGAEPEDDSQRQLCSRESRWHRRRGRGWGRRWGRRHDDPICKMRLNHNSNNKRNHQANHSTIIIPIWLYDYAASVWIY